MLCSLLQLSCRKLGARPGLDLILRQNCFPGILNDDFLEEGVGGGITADNSYLPYSL